MHIHGQALNVQDANLFGIANRNRALRGLRAAEARRRLRSVGRSEPLDLSLEDMLLIDQWTSAQPRPAQVGDEHRPVPSLSDLY